MERNRVLGSCSSCLLTPSAEQLLTRLEADLEASRGHDGTWASHACPDCGRTTVIRDDREGWSFGDSGWSFEPQEGSAADLPPTPASSSEWTSEWLTLAEAAYISGASVEDLTARVDSGRLEHVSILGEDRFGVLVRAEDVLAPPDGSGPAPRGRGPGPGRTRPRRRRRSDGLGGVTLVLVGALGLMFATALWWTGRVPSSADEAAGATASGLEVVAPEPISDATADEDAQPSPLAKPPAGENDDGPTIEPPAGSTRTTSGPSQPNLTVGPVEFVSGDDWVSAAVSIENSSSRWLPASEVTFLVLDPSGATVGSGYAIVDLAPGEEAIVVADGIELGPEPPQVAAVHAELVAAPLQAPERMDGSLFVADAGVRDSSVTGQVVNTGPARDVVRVDCAVYSSDGELSAVAIALVQPVAANEGATFLATIANAVGPLDTVACSAT